MNKLADSHVHYRNLKFDQIRRMLDLMHSIGVTDVCMLSLPYRSVAEDLCGLYWKLKYDKMTIRTFGGIHVADKYSTIPFEDQVKTLIDLGCDGIKIMNNPELRAKLGVGFNDKCFKKMFAYLQEKNIPVTMHVNDPRFFWENGTYNEGAVSFDTVYNEVLDMLDSFPELKITFAHFFFLSDDPDEAVRIMEKYKNVRFDLTPGTEMFVNFSKAPEFWHDFFIKYSDRILFGTDSNSIKSINDKLNYTVRQVLTRNYDEFVVHALYGTDWTLRGLNLDEATVNKICYDNFIEFAGEIRPVNEELFYQSCEKLLNEIKKNPVDEYYLAYNDINDSQNDLNQTIATDFLEKALSERFQ